MPQTLDEWLQYIERTHPQAIAMGLERVVAVKNALGLVPAFPVIIVGGTNGKGSACVMLEAILHAGGYRVGCYTSPHLVHYNERVRVAGEVATDEALCRAFAAVEAARRSSAEPVPLTYFEFGTLAAVWHFVHEGVDAAVLEVGLGGRLDAVNAFDPDCALVMTVAMDHMDYLGDTREKIGFEKAGIFRAGVPAVCADPDPPASLLEHAANIGAHQWNAGRDFGYETEPHQWRYWGPYGARPGLPYPALRGSVQVANAAACLAALDALRGRLPLAMGHIRTGLLQAENPARFQVLPGRPMVILDVAHNLEAASALAQSLSAMGRWTGRTFAVFGMLRDKDIAGVARALKGAVDCWHIAPLPGPRGTDTDFLRERLVEAGICGQITAFPDVATAFAAACEQAGVNDRIIAFGSFLTVAAAMQARATVPKK